MEIKSRITYSKEFDEKYTYEGVDLGAFCTEESTAFKIWSPLADRVILRIYSTGTQEEEAKVLAPSVYAGCYSMTEQEYGVFFLTLQGDLHGLYYDYEIVRGEEHIITADPYAVGCGANGFRSMITDLRCTDPEGFEKDHAPIVPEENVIYELHIKDFSQDPESGIREEYRGKYMAFTEECNSSMRVTGMAYLKEMGITHVHLLPFFDFAALDENGNGESFNWGYDPLNYNVPEGSYSTNPRDGVIRIRECKEMIQALHKAGIRVVMDVVYNHTYSADSWLERTVPGYYVRRWGDGTLSNGSGCGSDVAVGRAMVDHYIVQSVKYWAREYHIDGFRFDLMGLLTVELMNRLRTELDQEFGEGEILLYGEPWSAGPTASEEGTHLATKDNLSLLSDGIAIFSDDIRDSIKGHVFDAETPGFVNGRKGLEQQILSAAAAWRKGGSSMHPKSSAQIVNYVSAHDNLTLWDKLCITMKDEEFLQNPEAYRWKDPDVMAANKLAALIYFTCQGHVFFQAGEEFGRTKLGDENSYISSPEINMLRWEQTETFADLVAYYKGLIRLRKQAPGLRDKSPEASERISDETVWKEGVVSYLVDNRLDPTSDSCWKNSGNQLSAGSLKDTSEIPLENSSNRTSEFYSQNRDSALWAELMIILNVSDEVAEITIPEGDWSVLADAEQANCCYIAPLSQERVLKAAPHAGMILGRK